MISVRLTYNEGYKWFSKDGLYAKGFLFDEDDRLWSGQELIDYFATIVSFDEFTRKLERANGLFAVVVTRDESVWAAIDHARSFPLFYSHSGGQFMITDNPDTLYEDPLTFRMNEKSATLLSYSGFVPGHDTLLEDVSQLIAGEALRFENGNIETVFHTQFLSTVLSDKSREELKEELESVLAGVGRRMVQALNGRPVAIPLSGGFDSRLMAYLLRKNHYENVICYTYGFNDCVELNNARRTAQHLGYKLYFVDYEPHKDVDLTADPLFCDYVDFATNYACRFEEQDYYAVREMQAKGLLLPGTVFIPGNSGAIAGHLLSAEMGDERFSFVDHALDNVFGLIYPRRKDRRMIRREVAFLDEKDGRYPPYLIYENWRFQTTTALAFNGSRIWEFFGFEFLLPLWDKALYHFFRQVPLPHKYDKNLFKETLSELFGEYAIFFPEEELYPSDATLRRVGFNARLKKAFPVLKRLADPSKLDAVGAQYLLQGLVRELKTKGCYRKILNLNGVIALWYVQRVRGKVSPSSLYTSAPLSTKSAHQHSSRRYLRHPFRKYR